MKIYEINFEKCKTTYQLYEEIIEGMGFPSWCGKNMDAIWDMLIGNINIPAIIYLRGIDNIPKELYEEKDLLLEVLEKVSKWYKELGEYVEILKK